MLRACAVAIFINGASCTFAASIHAKKYLGIAAIAGAARSLADLLGISRACGDRNAINVIHGERRLCVALGVVVSQV
jgi:hypothetical protein